MIRRRVIVSGLVQGVAFRAYTRSTARSAGVNGWVRNLPDGKVEAVIEGPGDEVKSVLEWIKNGPPYARVDRVKIYEEPVTGEFTDFDIAHFRGDY